MLSTSLKEFFILFRLASPNNRSRSWWSCWWSRRGGWCCQQGQSITSSQTLSQIQNIYGPDHNGVPLWHHGTAGSGEPTFAKIYSKKISSEDSKDILGISSGRKSWQSNTLFLEKQTTPIIKILRPSNMARQTEIGFQYMRLNLHYTVHQQYNFLLRILSISMKYCFIKAPQL